MTITVIFILVYTTKVEINPVRQLLFTSLKVTGRV